MRRLQRRQRKNEAFCGAAGAAQEKNIGAPDFGGAAWHPGQRGRCCRRRSKLQEIDLWRRRRRENGFPAPQAPKKNAESLFVNADGFPYGPPRVTGAGRVTGAAGRVTGAT
eukprot:gene14431-biopygen23120